MIDFKSDLITSNLNKKSKIGIIGLGYVGLPLLLRFAEVGFNVYGFDVDSTKVKKLISGQSYLEHIPSNKINNLLNEKRFQVSTSFENIGDCEAVIICVPTPLKNGREPDLSYIVKTIDSILPNLRKGQLISLESTTYPGTTVEKIVKPVEKKGFTVGKDIFIAFSPEREDPGNKIYSTHNIPKVIGGHTENCLNVADSLYSQAIDKTVKVSGTSAAEMTKLLENIHRAVNIGLVNEMKIICNELGIDINEVINAAATKPFGFTPYYPGPGLGGHCIPIDPFYLTWKAKEFGLSTQLIEVSGNINDQMPSYVVEKTISALKNKNEKLKNIKVLIMGVAYKKNIDDTRESPSLKIINLLQNENYNVSYHDPHVPELSTRNLKENLSSIRADQIDYASFDAIILATDHDCFDYKKLLLSSKLIIDTRGKFPFNSDKVVNA